MGMCVSIPLRICASMINHNTPFPFDRPYSPVQRIAYPSGRLPYSTYDSPLYALNSEQFSRKDKEMGEAFVYLWYDAGWKRTGGPRYYIGKHKGTLDSGYVCSSKYMKPEWEERGCKQRGCRHLFGDKGHHGDFHRRVLAYGTEQEMIDFEIKLLETRKDYFRSRYYNRVVMWLPCNSGENHYKYKHGLCGTVEYERSRNKKYHEQNREGILLRKKRYYEQNKEKEQLRGKRYQEQNKEKIALRSKRYREQNKEKVALQYKRYQEQNKEKIALRYKRYREQNKEKIALTLKRYREKNREKILLYKKQYRERKKQEKLEILEGII